MSGIFLFILPFLLAADPAWMTKRIADWSEQDARQLLTNSPWVKKVAANVLAGLSPYQRREGGDMQAEGGGRDGLGLDPSLIGSVPNLMTGPQRRPPEDRSPPAIAQARDPLGKRTARSCGGNQNQRNRRA